ncbi:unnamed protein product [Clonostachys rosea f. rosea IK726]|uniref:Copper acquisition factor BIM1-like domain-containing protein n=2 Tax=Bionectria ochroleuca TaxID=29856 RepID=A0A0B7KJW9_BIOOC|nr:unnamed protein product [Clonostachys rosea f. rosea IK726]
MHSPTMIRTLFSLGLVAFAFGDSQEEFSGASVTDGKMGPAAFMWPPDRVWSGDIDNQPPCGSHESVGNRTNFPITGGTVALVAQDDYYDAKISISYSDNPKSNDDFNTLLQTKEISDLNPGHTCVNLTGISSSVKAGDKATFQIIYRADWDAPHNQTFYACSDITFVNAADFKFRIPCFNATEPGQDDKKKSGVTANPSATGIHKPTSSGSSEDQSSSSDSGSSGGSQLSGGAIAGIVVGSVAGVGLVIGAAVLLWRRRQKAQLRERIRRVENGAHGESGKPYGSQASM